MPKSNESSKRHEIVTEFGPSKDLKMQGLRLVLSFGAKTTKYNLSDCTTHEPSELKEITDEMLMAEANLLSFMDDIIDGLPGYSPEMHAVIEAQNKRLRGKDGK